MTTHTLTTRPRHKAQPITASTGWQGTQPRRSSFFAGVSHWLTIGLLVVAAVAHVPMTARHLDEAPYMGVLFVMFTAAALLLAGALAYWRSEIGYVAAAALCAAAVGAYVATRLVAFPMLGDDVGAWGEPLGVLCVATESAVVVLAGLKLLRK